MILKIPRDYPFYDVASPWSDTTFFQERITKITYWQWYTCTDYVCKNSNVL